MKIRKLFPFVLILVGILGVSLFLTTPVLAEGDTPEGAPEITPAGAPVGAPVGATHESPLQPLAEEEPASPPPAAPLMAQSGIEIQAYYAWYFCPLPGGKCMHSNAAGLQNAQALFAANHGSGLIYLQPGDFNGGVTFDATPSFTGIVPDPAIPGIVNVNGGLTARNLAAGFRVQGVNIAGSLWIHTIPGLIRVTDVNISNVGGPGLFINTPLAGIELLRVDSSSNAGRGAELNNTGGSKRTIKVTNSAFDANSDEMTGLAIWSDSTVTINGISAGGNGGNGTSIYARSVTILNSSFNGNHNGNVNDTLGRGVVIDTSGYGGSNIILNGVMARDNEEEGLFLVTPGNVTLNNVYIQGNGTTTTTSNDDGVWIDTCKLNAGVCSFTGTGNVLITNSEFAMHDGNPALSHRSGLEVQARGFITLREVRVDRNAYGFGAYLDNDYSTLAGRSVSITNSVFFDNHHIGLEVHSKGAIVLNNVTVQSNDNIGAKLSNSNAAGALPVTLLNSRFESNGINGLEINSNGSVLLTQVVARSNLNSGVVVHTEGKVVITASQFDDNNWHGLDAIAGSSIVLNGVSGSRNGYATGDGYGIGAYLEANTLGRPVSVLRSRFDANREYGLYIISRGAVVLNGVSACWNVDARHGDAIYSGTGVYIYNMDGNAGVTVASTLGTNHFDHNENSALDINSYHAVSVSGFTANHSSMIWGIQSVYVDTCAYDLGSLTCNNPIYAPVTISRAMIAGSYSAGMEIYAHGRVTLSSIVVMGSSGDGVYVRAPGYLVLASNSGFTGNNTYGLEVDVRGWGMVPGGTLTLVNSTWYGNGIFAGYRLLTD